MARRDRCGGGQLAAHRLGQGSAVLASGAGRERRAAAPDVAGVDVHLPHFPGE
ncbi:MAG TPA: hypothetical protein VIJ00_06275 [Nakamurella sp.]